jgi:hypothetical protein
MLGRTRSKGLPLVFNQVGKGISSFVLGLFLGLSAAVPSGIAVTLFILAAGALLSCVTAADVCCCSSFLVGMRCLRLLLFFCFHSDLLSQMSANLLPWHEPEQHAQHCPTAQAFVMECAAPTSIVRSTSRTAVIVKFELW